MMVLVERECLHVMLNASLYIIKASLEIDEASIESVYKLGVVVMERTELRFIENRAFLIRLTQPSNVISHPMTISMKLVKRGLLKWRRIVRL